MADPKVGIFTVIAALNEQAALLGYPANLSADAFQGANANQNVASITAVLSTGAAVMAALQANSNAGLLAIENGMA